MGTVVRADTDEMRTTAAGWQALGDGLGAGNGAPPIGLSSDWPSAAATNGIHGQAAAATAGFQARINGSAAASTNAANAFGAHEGVKASDIKDVMSLATSPLHDVIGMAGSLGSVSSSIGGTLGQLGGQAVSITTNLTSTLTSALSHAGGSLQNASIPMPTDHAAGHLDTGQNPPATAPAGPTVPDEPRNPLPPEPIDPQIKTI
jgi:hypothetical protein